MHPRLIAAALGALVAVLGLCMATALPWSFYYADGCWKEFLLIVVAAVAVGGTVFLLWRDPTAEYGLRDGFAIVTLGWVIAGILGALPYWFSGVLPSFVDALFESVSGFTTTGATVLTQIDGLPHAILFWRSFTHWLGGMGIGDDHDGEPAGGKES